MTGPLLKGSPSGGGYPLSAVAFAQNTRDEIRIIGGDGKIAGTLASSGGMKQTNYIAQTTLDEGQTPILCQTQYGDELAGSLTASYDSSPCADRGQNVVCIQERAVSENVNAGPNGKGFSEDGIAYTLEARNKVQAVAIHGTQDPIIGVNVAHALGRNMGQENAVVGVGIGGTDVGYSLRANPSHSGDKGDGGVNCNMAVSGISVRRLTPRECERLMGFPDDYTLVPHRGKPACDGPRYKALGNSWAVPMAAWIGRRIQMVDEIVSGGTVES